MSNGATIASVRLATPADVEPILKILTGPNGLYENSAQGLGVSMDVTRVKTHVHAACHRQGGVAGVLTVGGFVVGSIGIFIWQPWYSADWTLCEYWLFVLPEFRSTKAFDALQTFAEEHRQEMSKIMGRELMLQETIVTHDRLDKKIRLWKRRTKMIGAVFVMGGQS